MFVRKDNERRISKNSMAFDEFGVRVERFLFPNVWCNSKNEGIVWKCI
jgi:hypothetical protein